jgi:hypothetical protein
MKNKKQKELTNKVNELEQKVRLLEQVSIKQNLTTSIILSIIEGKKVTCDEADKEAPDPDPQHEPQTESKIVFDYLVGSSGDKHHPRQSPRDFYEVTQIYNIGDNSFLFAAKDKTWQYPYIYIGHYKD